MPMTAHILGRRTGPLRWSAPTCLALVAVGCGAPRNDPQRGPMAPDIFKIVKFFPASMWRDFDPADANPEGFQMTLYLISGKTDKGAFGDGTIQVDLHAATRDAEGRKKYEPVKRWSFAPADAFPFRVKEQSVMGWGYQLYPNWGDADVLGKEVRINVSYVRGDGKVIQSRPTFRTVPIYDMDAYLAARSGTQP